MAIWQAKQVCPDLVVLPADMGEYIRFSKMAREIYEKYTDQIEPFGLDESWLDVTSSIGLFGSAMRIAEEISERIEFELGITASIGVSDNKITAKLGSDYKKPDAITSGNYSASVTDTNGVLSDFNFSSNSGNGITFSQKGNTLTITATPEAAKGLSTEKTYSTTGSAYGIDPDEAVLCWYDSTGKYQSLASYTGTGLDPVRAYIKIKATVTEDKGSLTINKTDADTGKALAGVTYRLYDASGNKVADVTTGADGKAVFSDLALGSYTYQEISAPSGYVVGNTKYPITITSTTLNITATRTNALGKASVEISKVDADSNTPLQGAGFRLYDASGSPVAEG